MSKNYIFFLSCIGILALLVGCDNGQLSRSEVLKKIKEHGSFEAVVVDHKIADDGNFSELTNIGQTYYENGLIDPYEITYIKEGLFRRKSREFTKLVQPTKSSIGSIYDAHTVTWHDYKNKKVGWGYSNFDAYIADIESIDVAGIRKDGTDQNKRIVELTFNAKSNSIGKLFYPEEFEIPHFVEFVLYDDGWRFEKSRFDDSKANSNFVKNDLKSYRSKASVKHAVLWRMHEIGIYSENWKQIAQELEKSNQYWMIGSSAWAYHDHGMKDKAIKLYEDSVLPKVKETKDSQKIASFNQYFEKLKNTDSYLVRLSSARKEISQETKRIKEEIRVVKQLEQTAKELKAEKKAKEKVERQKVREANRIKKEAEQKERKRIANLEKESTTKNKSYGKFNCMTSLRGKSLIEITDVGFDSSENGVLNRCGDINFLYKNDDLVKSQCRSSYGKFYPCVGFKVVGKDYLSSSILFTNKADQEKFYNASVKSLKLWKQKYKELVDMP